jgi:hypothetical protein
LDFLPQVECVVARDQHLDDSDAETIQDSSLMCIKDAFQQESGQSNSGNTDRTRINMRTPARFETSGVTQPASASASSLVRASALSMALAAR